MYDRVGENLRAVTGYEELEFETRMCEDIRSKYTEDAELIDETIIDQFAERRIEGKFKAGELHATVRFFEDTWAVTWFHPREGKAGVLVSIDRSGSESSIGDVQYCVDYLESEIEPEIEFAE